MYSFIGLVVVAATYIIMHIVYYSAISSVAMGISNTVFSTGHLNVLLSLFVGTVGGIISSISLRSYLDKREPILTCLNKKRFVVACIISPVVMGGMYDKIVHIESVVVVFILSYQNGYFWESLSVLASRIDDEKN